MGVAISLLGYCVTSPARPGVLPELDQAWRSSHANAKLIRYYAEQVYPCGLDAEHVRACADMINAIGSQLQTKQILIPAGSADQFPEFKLKSLGAFGGFERFEVEAELPPSEDYNFRAFKTAYRERLDRALEAARVTLASPPLPNFISLAENLYEHLPVDKIRPKVAVDAVNALITAFDPHGGLFLQAEDAHRQTHPGQGIVGIGVTIQVVKDGVYLAEVYPGTGASDAGLKAGDVIVAIDGQPPALTDLENLVKQLRGIPGSTVSLRLLGRTDDVVVTRNPFEVSTVTAPRYFSRLGSKIAVIRIADFMGLETASQFASYLTSLDADTEGLIVDLRGDPGGSVDQAVSIGSQLIGPNLPIVIERGLDRGQLTNQYLELRGHSPKLTNLPLVVLVDQRSASASELVAGAVQDYSRGFIMGTRTFGKGTVQALVGFTPLSLRAPLEVTLLALRGEFDEHRTIARFYQPGGHTNQGVGITPDFEVFSKPDPTEDERTFFTELDEHPSALPPTGEPWMQPRPEEIEKLRFKCLDPGRARHLYEAAPYPEMVDYQLLSAEELLDCVVHSS